MNHGERIPVRAWHSTVLADMDFETYSGAGYVRRLGKWKTVVPAAKSGIGCVGAARYAEDDSTHLWSLAYDLKDDKGPRLWVPGCPAPSDLFEHIAQGRLIEAHNSEFEYYIWKYVCHARMGWPELPLDQLRCSAAKSRADGLPGALGEAAKAARVPVQKMTEGKRLIRKFCQPQNPTKNQPLENLDPALDPVDGGMFYEYNIFDIKSEASLSEVLPDIEGAELAVWMADKSINARGVQVDAVGMAAAIAVVNTAIDVHTVELTELTGGMVDSANKNAKFIEWLRLQGAGMPNMQKETVEAKLADPGDMPPQALRALQIRDAIGGAAVKKLFALERYIMSDGRVRGLFVYHGCHTGRWTGKGPQPQNFPNSGPKVFLCPCGAYRDRSVAVCPCGRAEQVASDWDTRAVDECLRMFQHGYDVAARFFPKPLAAVSGCLRGLFISAPGHDLICSDYSAIEAVVLAMISGETWREEVFRGHGMIYEMSASKISGVPFEEFVKHKEETGDHHPLRKKLGKVAELASGYGGGLGAWKNFGADEFMADAEIEASKKAWRAESPMIVKFWYSVEDAARNAIKYPGKSFDCRGFKFAVADNILHIRLLSGRYLHYHEPLLVPGLTPWGAEVEEITFMWEDSKTKKWVHNGTFGGCLVENLCQAVARDILAFAMVNLEKAGYPLVLHVHDEPVSEIPEGFGSVEEYERIMMTMPDWCKDWPIKASGGWRGKRYRK